jgi:hypothetical protein
MQYFCYQAVVCIFAKKAGNEVIFFLLQLCYYNKINALICPTKSNRVLLRWRRPPISTFPHTYYYIVQQPVKIRRRQADFRRQQAEY